MNPQKPEEKVIELLLQLFRKNNYVTESEIADVCDDYDIPFHRTDYITENLLAKGVLISESPLVITIDEPLNVASFAEKNESVDELDVHDEVVYSYFEDNYPGMIPVIESVRKYYSPTDISLSKLIKQMQNGNVLAREALIRRYLKSALKISYNYRYKTVIPLEDLFSVAVQGIIDGISHYNKNVVSYFASYINFWMRQKIDRYIADNQAVIRIPVHLHEKYNNCTILKNEPVDLDILESSLKNRKDVQMCVKLIQLQCYESIDEMKENDKEIIDYEDQAIYERIENKEINTLLSKMIDFLGEKALDVLYYRYGLKNYDTHTLEETGKKYGVTRERIRQIEASTFRKIRNSPKYSRLFENYR